MSLKQQLKDNMTEWQERIASEDTSFWFSDSYLVESTALNTELESCTHELIDNIKASEERNTLVTNLNFLRNLLICWGEGRVRNVVKVKQLSELKSKWVERIQQTLDLLETIVEQEPEVAEVETVGHTIPAGQKTLFTTKSKQRRKETDQNSDFDGAVFLSDAEETLEGWRDSRRKLPNANAKNAPNVTTTRVPIIPKFEPYVSAEDLNSVGFKSEQLGTYTIMSDQILIGMNMKWVREMALSKAERKLLLDDALAGLTKKYGVPMLLVHEKGLAAPQNGYQFYWVMSEQHLATIRTELEASPIDWGLV